MGGEVDERYTFTAWTPRPPGRGVHAVVFFGKSVVAVEESAEMIRALGPVAALLLSVAFLLMGNGLQNTLTPVRADLDGFSSIGLGLLGGGYFAGFGLGCLLGPRWVRRAGHIRAFPAMVAVASSATLLQAVFVDVAAWIAFRFVSGVCIAVLFMIIESWLNERATNETRGFVFSAYIVVNLTVVTLGQLMLVLDHPLNFSLFALASLLVSLAAVPPAITERCAAELIDAGLLTRHGSQVLRLDDGVIRSRHSVRPLNQTRPWSG